MIFSINAEYSGDDGLDRGRLFGGRGDELGVEPASFQLFNSDGKVVAGDIVSGLGGCNGLFPPFKQRSWLYRSGGWNRVHDRCRD